MQVVVLYGTLSNFLQDILNHKNIVGQELTEFRVTIVFRDRGPG